MQRRGRCWPGRRRGCRRNRPRRPGAQRRLQPIAQLRWIEGPGDDQERVVRSPVRRVEGARVGQGQVLQRAGVPFDRAAIRVLLAEQQPVGDHAHDRFGLVAALHGGRMAVSQHALPIALGQARPNQHVAGQIQRGEERLPGRLHGQLRAVAAAAQPQIGAQMLQRVRECQRVAFAGSLVQNFGRQRSQAGLLGALGAGAAADHQRRRDDRRHFPVDRHHRKPVRKREARGRWHQHGGQRPDGRCGQHRVGRRGHAVTGSGSVCIASRLPARTFANASRTDARVAARYRSTSRSAPSGVPSTY